MKVALAQLAPTLFKKEANIEKMREVFEGREIDLAVFGEMFLTGYMCRDMFPRLAETLSGKSVQSIAKIAEENNSSIIFGMPEKDEKTKSLFNSSVFISPREEIESYRKIYTANFGPFEEGLYFERGRELKMIPSPLGKIGLLICYDIFFPELAKMYALQGADILCCISAAPSTSKSFFEKILPARALENTTFVLYTNLVGTELNMVFGGGTVALGPRGEEKAKAKNFEEDIVEFDLDLKELEIAREFRPTLRDTRLEILAALRTMSPFKAKR